MALITLPSATDIVASSTQASQALFDPTFPVVLFALGFVIGALVVVFIIRYLMRAVTKVFGGGRRGGRRRRR